MEKKINLSRADKFDPSNFGMNKISPRISGNTWSEADEASELIIPSISYIFLNQDACSREYAYLLIVVKASKFKWGGGRGVDAKELSAIDMLLKKNAEANWQNKRNIYYESHHAYTSIFYLPKNSKP